MSTAAAQITVKQFWKLCGDGRSRELVAGEVLELAPGSFEHGRVAGEALFVLKAFLRQNPQIGQVLANDTGFLLSRDPDTVRGPDIAFVRRERLANRPTEGYFPGAPDLAVEVVSPNDLAQEVERKVQEYLAAGTAMVWVLYPETKHPVVYRPDGHARVLGERDAVEGADLLPGFACKVSELFA